ncbi:MAG: hypothetical protein ABI467_26390 [Kofleriaceae bacterium]
MLVWILVAACQSSDVSRQVGARCDTNADCDVKCLAPDGAWPGGFCTVLCDSDANCPADTRCIEDQGGICAFTCAGDPGCTFLGDGYTCQQVDSHGGGVKVSACHGG